MLNTHKHIQKKIKNIISTNAKFNFSSLCERYAPYPIPTGAGQATTAHHHHHHPGAPSTTAVAPQTAHVHQQPQATHQPPGLAAAQAAVPQPFPYGIPNVDMTSFQNVDWSNIYGMYV